MKVQQRQNRSFGHERTAVGWVKQARERGATQQQEARGTRTLNAFRAMPIDQQLLCASRIFLLGRGSRLDPRLRPFA